MVWEGSTGLLDPLDKSSLSLLWILSSMNNLYPLILVVWVARFRVFISILWLPTYLSFLIISVFCASIHAVESLCLVVKYYLTIRCFINSFHISILDVLLIIYGITLVLSLFFSHKNFLIISLIQYLWTSRSSKIFIERQSQKLDCLERHCCDIVCYCENHKPNQNPTLYLLLFLWRPCTKECEEWTDNIERHFICYM